MKKIRVMIVEDSRTIRMLLEHLISSDPRLEVAASVETGEQALEVLGRTRPDVISLDIRLPGIDGFELTRRIMREQPTPIVICSASVENEELDISLDALKAGALSVVEKPVGAGCEDADRLAQRLCRQLAIMSGVKPIRQWQRRTPPVAAAPANRSAAAGTAGPEMVGVVASTGGPDAVCRLLEGLGSDFTPPILLVQHIDASFNAGFVRWLDGISPLAVREAGAGSAPEAGHVYVAPADRHLQLAEGRLQVDAGEPVCGQRPSGTVLLGSLARSLGPRAAGVVLTGMGEDGAAGLAELRAAGGYTIVEDESTAVVYGMPKAAADLGGACDMLPIHAIAPRLRHVAATDRGED